MNRRGFTLIELLVVLAASSALLFVLASISRGMQATARQTENRHDVSRNWDSLAHQFRSDVRRARSVDIQDSRCVLAAGNRRWEYAFASPRLEIAEWQGQEKIRQETYRLSPDTRVHFSRRSEGAGVVVSLTRKNLGAKNAEHRAAHVLAILGADHRLGEPMP